MRAREIEYLTKDMRVKSFDEIGQALGITRGGAWMLYRSAMRKLRRPCNRAALMEFRQLLNMKLRREN